MTLNAVHINIGELMVSIETDHNYPDAIDDMTGRARKLLKGVLEDMKTVGVDFEDLIEGVRDSSYDDEDEDEEEEA